MNIDIHLDNFKGIVVEIDKLIKQSKFTDGFQKAMINVIYTANHFRDTHAPIFQKYKIQSQHFNVLRILKGRHPEPITPGYIKEVILDKGRDITRLIDKLETLGWVARKTCNINKRNIKLSLTDSGLEHINQISIEVKAKDKDIRTMSEEEYLLLSNLLDKMRNVT